MFNDATKTVSYPLRTVTINPEFTDGTVGSAVIRFNQLGMTPGALIKVYPGLTATGTPAETINNDNTASYLWTTRTYAGPVTITFESPIAAASGNFDIDIVYTTGDQVITSPFGFQVAYWKSFITPNAPVFIDSHPDHAVPIAIAYFNESKQLVSSEISFCVDYGQGAPLLGNEYPGQMIFHPTVRTDFDENGSVQPIDQLTAARMLYVISNAPQPISVEANYMAVQSAIDQLSDNPNGDLSGLAGDAQDAIPSLPSPVEPDFSVTGPGSTVSAGSAQNFTVNLTNPGTGPMVFTLEVPAGVTINSATGTGVTYNAGNKTITFASSPASATVSVTNASAGTATLRVLYNQSNFWNINNLLVYEPCDDYPKDENQGFLGIRQGNNPKPYREASAAWTTALNPLACTDGYYQINYFQPNIGTLRHIGSGSTTIIQNLTGDFNAVGYSTLDNFLWGYDRATDQVFKLGANGSELYAIPNMPAPATNKSRTVGTVDLNGYLYLYEPNAAQYITVDINPARAATYLKIVDPTNSYTAKTAAPWGTATTPRNISDWAYNPATGQIHALINGGGSNAFYISSLNPVTGTSTLSATAVNGTITTSNAIYDSQFFDPNGNLIVYYASRWYSVNPVTNEVTDLGSKSEPLSLGNDGATCLQFTAPTSFTCNNLYYQVETDELYSIDGNGTRSLVASLSGSLDAIGYSTTDNFLWGYDNASGQVFKLGANGVIQRFGISNIPATTHPDGYSVGTVGANGYLYLYEKNASQYITIDINPANAETYLKVVDPTAGFAIKTAAPWGTALSGGAQGISDWSFNISDGQIYALTDGNSATPYRVLQVNPLTGATTLQPGQVTGSGLQTGDQSFGSSIIDGSGNFIVFGNTTGNFYLINITTKTATTFTNVAASPSGNNDGAFCSLASSPALPVTLISFKASREGKVATLRWSTASEVNSKGFEIERSATASDWTKIGFVETQSQKGQSVSQLNYNFTDPQPLAGWNYYRLKMVDLDGTYTYSHIDALRGEGGQKTMFAYPNPVVNGKLSIGGAPGTGTRKVEVYNLSGLRVLQSDLGQNNELNVGNLVSGMYVLRIKAPGGEVQTSTFVVQ
ncbi:hypothetical protein GCM10023091_32850 [Ravibacter arvi]|uniref:Secretion system C-terminal sorting domain-containing protein n=1 Tax=Ravibacter arvi TaxID=2051041 RepID=A0ABP8M6L2_9BACT